MSPADPPVLRHHPCGFEHKAEAETKNDAKRQGTGDELCDMAGGASDTKQQPDEPVARLAPNTMAGVMRIRLSRLHCSNRAGTGSGGWILGAVIGAAN